MSTAPEVLLGISEVDADLHIATNNFAPNEFREVVNLSGLVVYKGSNARVVIVVVIAMERK